MHKVHICTQHLASFAILIRFLFCGGFKSISRRTVRRLIALHPKQNIESELKWKTCSGKMPSKCSCSTGKGLRSVSGNRCLDHLSATNLKVVLPRCVCCRIHCARSAGTIAIQLCFCGLAFRSFETILMTIELFYTDSTNSFGYDLI